MNIDPSFAHRATITERLAVQVGEQIFAGKLKPGVPLREADLAAQFAVSRHVIREVLRTLAADGMVVYASFRGARVPLLSVEDARDIFRARRMLEASADAMPILPDASVIGAIHRRFVAAVKVKDWPAAFNLDRLFHEKIMETAGSARMSAWLTTLQKDLRLAYLVAPSFNEEGFVDSVGQHGEIVAALEAKDRTRALAAMRAHLDAAEDDLLEGMERRRN